MCFACVAEDRSFSGHLHRLPQRHVLRKLLENGGGRKAHSSAIKDCPRSLDILSSFLEYRRVTVPFPGPFGETRLTSLFLLPYVSFSYHTEPKSHTFVWHVPGEGREKSGFSFSLFRGISGRKMFSLGESSSLKKLAPWLRTPKPEAAVEDKNRRGVYSRKLQCMESGVDNRSPTSTEVSSDFPAFNSRTPLAYRSPAFTTVEIRSLHTYVHSTPKVPGPSWPAFCFN